MLANKSDPQFKVKVISAYEDCIPDFCRSFRLSGPNVVDELASETEHWSPENPILIDAPPGTGKTTFVYNSLIPRALEAGKNILLVSNRIALSTQQKAKIMEILDSPLRKLLTPEGVRKCEDFDAVRVITYHRLPALLQDPEARPWLANLGFVVFDEAHFFVADSMFNDRCDYLLKLATTRFCHAIRVYISATTWDLLVPLADAEKQFFHVSNLGSLILGPSVSGPPPCYRAFYRYWMSASHSHYHLHFFNVLNDLIPLIEAYPDKKWMIFVDKKAVGRQFCEALGDKATYLDAASKGTNAWDSVIQTESFPCQVLVTTSALDCGVNIRDSALKHIAVITDNRVSLVQMLGRKRPDPGEHVDLWVCDLDRRVIAARANRLRAYLSWYDRLDRCKSRERQMEVAQDIWQAEDPMLRKLFRLAKGGLFPNRLAYYAIQRRLYVFRGILSGELSFRETVASWLGMEPPSQQDRCIQLEAFYDTWGEKTLSTKQQADLREIICGLYSSTGHKDPQPKRVSSLGYQALSNRLREMGLPYRVEADGDTWTLCRKSDS